MKQTLNIAKTAIVDPTANIAPSAVISDFCLIGEGVKIGNNSFIGPYTIIKDGAEIGEHNHIAEYCTIGGKTKIGNWNNIGSHCSIIGRTTIENRNKFKAGVKIGERPCDNSDKLLAYSNIDNLHNADIPYHGSIVIGNENLFCEGVVINVGEKIGDNDTVTRIGNRVNIMPCSVIHHNAQIGFGDNYPDLDTPIRTTICSNVICNGYVEVHKGAYIGSGSNIHHWRIVGSGAQVAMGSSVVRDVLPFSKFIAGRITGIYEKNLKNEWGWTFEGAFGYLLKYIKELSKNAESSEEISKIAEKITLGINGEDANLQPFNILRDFALSPRNKGALAKWKE